MLRGSSEIKNHLKHTHYTVFIYFTVLKVHTTKSRLLILSGSARFLVPRVGGSESDARLIKDTKILYLRTTSFSSIDYINLYLSTVQGTLISLFGLAETT